MWLWGAGFWTVRGSCVITRTNHFVFGALHRGTVELVLQNWNYMNHLVIAHQQQRIWVQWPDGERWESCALLPTELPIVNYPTTVQVELVRHW